MLWWLKSMDLSLKLVLNQTITGGHRHFTAIDKNVGHHQHQTLAVLIRPKNQKRSLIPIPGQTRY
jgi:hypothetical protein